MHIEWSDVKKYMEFDTTPQCPLLQPGTKCNRLGHDFGHIIIMFQSDECLLDDRRQTRLRKIY